jgi:type IV secretion system protein VirB3
MNHDTLFRGATRPPMFLGVPVIPLMLVGLGLIVPTMYISLKFAFAMIPAYVIMQALVKIDEQIFDLLGLRIKTSLITIANSKTKRGDRIVGPHACKRDNWF